MGGEAASCMPGSVQACKRRRHVSFLSKGTPEIREHYLDSKKDVDHHLKSACEQFIQQQTKQFVEQLEEFMTKVWAWLQFL